MAAGCSGPPFLRRRPFDRKEREALVSARCQHRRLLDTKATAMSDDGDYVLGTRDDELERLGFQHRVWRPKALEAWRRAGLAAGDTALDIGAGPGFASVDLAEIVGRDGRVVALERAPHFLAALGERAAAAPLGNIEVRAHDVSANGFGEGDADFAWCRWLLSFVADPARTVAHVARALKPGGTAVFHEYADYGSWRMMPPDPDVDRFRELVVRSWRDAGGEPDVALSLPAWLNAEGFDVVETRAHVEILRPDDILWQWPVWFMAVGAHRLHELGYIDAAEAGRLGRALDNPAPETRMMTPLVAEIIARRR